MNKAALVHGLIDERVLRTERLINAFGAVDRADFVPPEYADDAYLDTALPIGYGQTISQPYTVACMLELLQPQQGDRVLDVGSGSGWTTALLAHCVGTEGRVYGVERVPELLAFGMENVAKYDFANTAMQQASEHALGLVAHAPYDKILVSAASDTLPLELVKQLRPGGTMVLPIRSALVAVHKDDAGAIQTEPHEGFAFVPLVHH